MLKYKIKNSDKLIPFDCVFFNAILCSDTNTSLDSPHDAVLIDSLLSMDQYRGAERTTSGPDGKPTKDIAEVAAATDLILPKGSARITMIVSNL